MQWDVYGLTIMVVYLSSFYLWYQFFMLYKLYRAMRNNSRKNPDQQERQMIDFVRIIIELFICGLVLILGIVLWISGSVLPLTVRNSRLLIRSGECVAQGHLVLNVIFLKRIREFTFPKRQNKTIEVPEFSRQMEMTADHHSQ
jgi:hypothetical protein